jgi:hypothetical protein
MFDRLLLFG